MNIDKRIVKKKRMKTAKSKLIRIRWSIVIVLSTTIRQNLFGLARLLSGNDESFWFGKAKLTLFIDSNVVVSVALVPVVFRRSKMLKKLKFYIIAYYYCLLLLLIIIAYCCQTSFEECITDLCFSKTIFIL